ncbi:hypothetical protein FGE12_08410 [Aggregicoccus sp. 17bor-14]|uniref:hypothetical protein n=1 Tax=Myxococcaceae TaxID=31 RepID=UPI00129C2741|nr:MULTISPECIES: hypothetical protein [Myxococcaceae]MBF5042420.1 hypothetical protein [Simulacricoccus sp. 17bor-14]MRI88192.1 hypothetical protein [Aggregicoccus sp. 17bor-14]
MHPYAQYQVLMSQHAAHARGSRATALLLALAAGALGCNVVDPVAGLHEFTDACVVRENCSDGFVCVQGHCVTAPGAECVEGFKAAPCELTAGVCAGAERACLPSGRSEATCNIAAYGPHYEPVELSCDGLDNDCDGVADARRVVSLPILTYSSFSGTATEMHAVRFGSNYLAAWLDNKRNVGVTGRSAISYRVLDARLMPMSSGTVELEGYDASIDNNTGLPRSTSSRVAGLQQVRFAGGAFILWSSFDASTSRNVHKMVRLDAVAAASGAVVGAAPRALTLPGSPAPSLDGVRAAVAADGSSLLVAWLTGTQVMGQSYNLDLTPRAEPVVLSASLASDDYEPSLGQLDVSPHGSSDFAVAWGSTASDGTSRRVVRFRTVSGDLAQLGEVVGSDVKGALSGLRLLAGTTPSEQPLAAWLTQAETSSSSSVHAAASTGGDLVVARPFTPSGPAAQPVGVTGVRRLDAVRDGDDLLLPYVEGSSLVVRRIGADGTTEVHSLGAPADASAFAVLTDVDPALYTVAFTQGGTPQVGATCRH